MRNVQYLRNNGGKSPNIVDWIIHKKFRNRWKLNFRLHLFVRRKYKNKMFVCIIWLEFDWMHETARCIGYPSDSTRAARERAREATCGYCLRWSGHAQPGQASPNQASASTPSPLRPRLSPLWLNSSPRGLPLAAVAQLWSASGSAHQPLAMGV